MYMKILKNPPALFYGILTLVWFFSLCELLYKLLWAVDMDKVWSSTFGRSSFRTIWITEVTVYLVLFLTTTFILWSLLRRDKK